MVDLSNGPSGEFHGRFRECVGTGHLGLALQEEYLQHLDLVQESIGFRYIRGHGILSDSMGVYRDRLPYWKGDRVFDEPFFGFSHVDQVFDAYQKRGVRPFVELGFMPSQLASGTQTQFYWKGNVTPPKDYDLYRKMITALVTHLIDRYGATEVRSWPFEVWNEPNLVQFWENADPAEYFKLYRETYAAIKTVDSQIMVGGPATAPGGIDWMGDFLERCSGAGVGVDFASHHAYSATALDLGPQLGYHGVRDEQRLVSVFESARRMVDSTNFAGVPLHITEYNSSYNPLAPIHDTAFNAAFIAYTLAHGDDACDSFSYWTFSDVFEELDIAKSQFHGGFGLVARHGIPKPTFHAFAFFSRLGNTLLYRDQNSIVTRNKNTIAIVAWNPAPQGAQTRNISFRLPIGGTSFVNRYQVTDEYANPLRSWREMGRPRYPSDRQVRVLHDAAVPYHSTRRIESGAPTTELSFSLAPNETTLIEVTPVRDQSASYIGLDDSRVPGHPEYAE